MASIDENAEVGLELTTSTLRLTGRSIIAIMDLFLKKDDRKDYYQDLNNKQGKQKLKDLFTKYEDTGVQSLGKNLSDEEKKFFEKEFKSMGVDFSIRKVGKDNYSLFFAGKDSEAIEKGIENAVQKYAQREKRIENLKDKLNFKKINKDEVVDKKEKKQDQNEKLDVNEITDPEVKKEIIELDKKIESREQDQYYSDSWEQSKQIREDIEKLKTKRSEIIENSKDKLNFKKINKDEVVSKKEKKQDQKEKPKFTVNELQEKHIKKQKENSKEKVRNKTKNKSL